jgi:hypothetical protein
MNETQTETLRQTGSPLDPRHAYPPIWSAVSVRWVVLDEATLVSLKPTTPT